MSILYTKEILHRSDTSELTFALFFKLVDEFVHSNTILLGPKNSIHNQLALYSRKKGAEIVLYTMHTTSDNDNTNIGKCISDLLAKEPDYDYYVGVNNIVIGGGTSENKGKEYPGIQLYGEDRSSDKFEDVQQEKKKRKVYRINFGVPQRTVIGLEWLHLGTNN
jgi:hypothetical protein